MSIENNISKSTLGLKGQKPPIRANGTTVLSNTHVKGLVRPSLSFDSIHDLDGKRPNYRYELNTPENRTF